MFSTKKMELPEKVKECLTRFTRLIDDDLLINQDMSKFPDMMEFMKQNVEHMDCQAIFGSLSENKLIKPEVYRNFKLMHNTATTKIRLAQEEIVNNLIEPTQAPTKVWQDKLVDAIPEIGFSIGQLILLVSIAIVMGQVIRTRKCGITYFQLITTIFCLSLFTLCDFMLKLYFAGAITGLTTSIWIFLFIFKILYCREDYKQVRRNIVIQ